MSTSYYPRTDSFPAQVCGFFANNPDEVLTIDDMVDKFMPASRGNIHTQLALALEAKLLSRRRDDQGEYIYGKGPQLKITGWVDTASAPASAPAPAAKAKAKRAVLDLSTIVIRDDVPLPNKNLRTGLIVQLMQLLNGLKPGQSFELPVGGKSVLQKAVQQVHVASKARFSVRVDETTQKVGVWCDTRAES